MKKQIIILLIMVRILFVTGGCVSNEFANKQIARCPQYLQNNIGQVKAEPLSPLGLIFRGYVNSGEPNQPIHLYGFADKNVVLHEAFHSFELRAWKERNDEWELFQYDFIIENDIYLGHLVTVAMMFVPFIEQVPIPGKVRLYSSLSQFEDTADCFVYWIHNGQRKDLQPKLKAIEKFVTGTYRGD